MISENERVSDIINCLISSKLSGSVLCAIKELYDADGTALDYSYFRQTVLENYHRKGGNLEISGIIHNRGLGERAKELFGKKYNPPISLFYNCRGRGDSKTFELTQAFRLVIDATPEFQSILSHDIGALRKKSYKAGTLFTRESFSWNTTSTTEVTYPDEEKDNEGYEGALSRVLVNRYERDKNFRDQCLAHYGSYACQVCEFDFEKSYGDIGKQFIHVHHTIPLHQITQPYKLNPKTQLVPVCPNCHAMLHKRKPDPYTVEELREIIRDTRKIKGH